MEKTINMKSFVNDMRGRGYSCRHIANMGNVGRTTVSQWAYSDVERRVSTAVWFLDNMKAELNEMINQVEIMERTLKNE